MTVNLQLIVQVLIYILELGCQLKIKNKQKSNTLKNNFLIIVLLTNI